MDFGKEKKSLDMLAAAAVGGVIAAVCAVILLTVFAALTLFSGDPASLSWIGTAILLLCCFAGAFTGAKCTEKRPFIAGLISGAMFIVTVLIISLIAAGKLHPAFIPATAGCALCGAFLGSIRRSAGHIPAFDDKRFDKYGNK